MGNIVYIPTFSSVTQVTIPVQFISGYMDTPQNDQ